MKTQIITLKITVDEDNYSLPNEWNWQDLLDLTPNESVEVLHSEEE